MAEEMHWEEETMEELGAWLRETREAQGLSLEEVEAHTRIRRSFLQALEEGNYDALPDEVCVRGFLRNYALFLGLDPEEVRRRYSQELPQRTREGGSFRPIDAALEPPARPRSVLVMRIVLISFLLAGATAAGLWYWYGWPLPQLPAWWPPQLGAILAPATLVHSSPTSTSPAPTRMLPAPTATMAPTSPPPTSTHTPLPPTMTSTPLSPTNTSTPSPVPMTPTPMAIATSAVLPLPTPTSVPTATPTPTPSPLPSPSEGIELKAKAIERAWLMVTVDGEVEFQGLLEAGEERTWHAERSIEFRCGNAGGVLVTVNGEELGVLGERGQVVDQTWVVQEEQVTTATPSSP